MRLLVVAFRRGRVQTAFAGIERRIAKVLLLQARHAAVDRRKRRHFHRMHRVVELLLLLLLLLVVGGKAGRAL